VTFSGNVHLAQLRGDQILAVVLPWRTPKNGSVEVRLFEEISNKTGALRFNSY